MPIKTYRNRLSGQVIRILIPDIPVERGKLLCRSELSHEQFGKLKFKYDDEARALIILDIDIKLKCSGLGSLMIVDLTNTAMLWFPGLLRVVADSVAIDARGFYLQLGFRPPIEHLVMNSRFISPPDDVGRFVSGYFQNMKKPEAVLYQDSSGREVTRSIFTQRVKSAREVADWEVLPWTLIAQAQTRNIWDYICTDQRL